MLEGTRIDLSKHRLARAKEVIAEAEYALKGGMYKNANNRAYYAIFNTYESNISIRYGGF